MAADWYCWNDGIEHGPITSDQLRTMARNGQLSPDDQVRKGENAAWYAASRIKGLFPDPAEADARQVGSAKLAIEGAGLPDVRSIADCVSVEERRKRPGILLVNVLVWFGLVVLAVATMGVTLVIAAIGWILARIFAEYNVRRLQAYGTSASEGQFPEIARALAEVRAQFGVRDEPRIIIVSHSAVNAFAIRFARKKVILLLSEMLEGVLDEPAQLRFILAHELAHVALDHGPRGSFELYKPAAYKAARELTCDNCGCAAAGDLDAARSALKRLGVGNQLHHYLDDRALIAEAHYLESGLTGWLLKQYLTHPPLGRRIANVIGFFEAKGLAKPAPDPRWDDPVDAVRGVSV